MQNDLSPAHVSTSNIHTGAHGSVMNNCLHHDELQEPTAHTVACDHAVYAWKALALLCIAE